jgi:hypothetical protein
VPAGNGKDSSGTLVNHCSSRSDDERWHDLHVRRPREGHGQQEGTHASAGLSHARVMSCCLRVQMSIDSKSDCWNQTHHLSLQKISVSVVGESHTVRLCWISQEFACEPRPSVHGSVLWPIPASAQVREYMWPCVPRGH